VAVEQEIDLFKVKIDQGVTIELVGQFVLGLQIEAVGKIDLEFLPEQLVPPTVLIIGQGFHLV
tara:strand:- start:281 stop:469 length:189 start_codon:yes stop_codon:yes gene_type:complete